MYKIVKNTNDDIVLYLKYNNNYEPYTTLHKNSQISFVTGQNSEKIGVKITTNNSSVFSFLVHEFDSYQILPNAAINFVGDVFDLFNVFQSEIFKTKFSNSGTVQNFDVNAVNIVSNYTSDEQDVESFKSISAGILIDGITGSGVNLQVSLQTLLVDEYVNVYQFNIKYKGLYNVPEITINSPYRWNFVVSGSNAEFLTSIVSYRNSNFGNNFASYFDYTNDVLIAKNNNSTNSYNFEIFENVNIFINSLSAVAPCQVMPQISYDSVTWVNALKSATTVGATGLTHINFPNYGKYVRLLVTIAGNAQTLEYVQFYAKK